MTRKRTQEGTEGETTFAPSSTVPFDDWTTVEGEQPRAVRHVTDELLSLASALQDGTQRIVRASDQRKAQADILRRLLNQAGYKLKITPSVRDDGSGVLIEILSIKAVRRPTEEEAATAKAEREAKKAEREARKAAETAAKEAAHLAEAMQQAEEGSWVA